MPDGGQVPRGIYRPPSSVSLQCLVCLLTYLGGGQPAPSRPQARLELLQGSLYSFLRLAFAEWTPSMPTPSSLVLKGLHFIISLPPLSSSSFFCFFCM